MEYGGTRTSLVNLLHNIEHETDLYVDLFIINQEGDLLNQIPKTVNILPEVKQASYALPNIRRKGLRYFVYHNFVAICNRLFGYQAVYKSIYFLFGGSLFRIGRGYDAVFAYQEGISTLTGSLIPAKKHFIWIHSDVDKWYDKRTFEKSAFDMAQNVIFVAENTKQLFANMFPQYSNKCIVIKNTLNKDAILEKANLPVMLPKVDGLSLLSIGRFTEAKAFDRVILASKYLKVKGYRFTWTLLGDGELFDSIKQMAVDNNVDDVVQFMGAQSNPFVYIKNTDVVVVSSVNESQPMVILESLTLSKPVVSTGFGSAREILCNGKYGLICDNKTDAFISAVESLFIDTSIIQQLKVAAKEYEYDNDAIVKRLKEII